MDPAEACFPFNNELVKIWDGSRTDYQCLPMPSLAERQMIAAYRMTSYILRIVSSSKRDKQDHAAGLDAAAHSTSRGSFAANDDDCLLQRAIKKHVISYRQDFVGMMRSLRTSETHGATLRVDDVAASFYHNLGIDPSTEFNSSTGRPITLVRDGSIIKQLFS